MTISQFPSGGRIKSIQRGTVAGSRGGSNTSPTPITISAINPAKAVVRFLEGQPWVGNAFVTSVTATSIAFETSYRSHVLYYEVVEYC